MTYIVGILGSVTPPGRLSRALARALDTVPSMQPEARTRLLDLAQYRLSFADGRPLDQLGDDSATAVAAVGDADAVIFASPVYRASFTGALKNLLDLLPIEALRGKACGIVAMGAGQQHYLGVDWHLRDVLAWFGAVVAPTSVYLSSADFVEGELGEAAQADLRALLDGVCRLSDALKVAGPFGPAPLAARRQ